MCFTGCTETWGWGYGENEKSRETRSQAAPPVINSNEDLSRVTKELAEVRQQILDSKSVAPPPCPTCDCDVYDDSAMKQQDALLQQQLVNLEKQVQSLTAHLTKLEEESREKSCPEPVKLTNDESARVDENILTSESNEVRKLRGGGSAESDSESSNIVIIEELLETRLSGILNNMAEKQSDLIKAAIDKYDADKTGRPDLALESGGGSVVSTRCTKKSDFVSSTVSIFGIPIYYPSNSPRKVIQVRIRLSVGFKVQVYLITQRSTNPVPTKPVI